MSERPDLSASDFERLRGLYHEATRAVPAAGPHPSEDDWVRLAADELSVDERTALADHVVVCRRCRDTYRVVMDVRQQAPAAGPAPVQAGSQADERLAPPNGSSSPPAWGWRELALAASVLAAIGAGVWVWSLRSRVGALEGQLAAARSDGDIARLRAALEEVEERAAQLERDLAAGQQPGVNAPIVDLEPEVVRGDGRRRSEVVVSGSARYFTLVFTFTTGTAPGAPFTLEIARPDGTRLGAWPGVAPGPFQTAAVVVPAALAPPGEYTVRLLDESGAAMQTHVLLVRADGAPASR